MSLLKLAFSELARKDLRSILRYTLKTWGERQRDSYRQSIRDAALNLTQFPRLGETMEDVLPGIRSRKVGQHVIYYRLDDDTVTIVRILHEKMDAGGIIG
jgi:toxin ParE1/3/4